MKRTVLSLILAGVLAVPSTSGAIDLVLDSANLGQAIATVEALGEQLGRMDREIRLVEDQLDRATTNTVAPLAYRWSQAEDTMNRLRGMVDTVRNLRTQYGSLENYSRKFQDASYYRSSPCFGPQGCSAAERARLEESATAGSAAQKQANDAMLRGLDAQQNQIEADDQRLRTLQSAAEGVNGTRDGGGQLAALQAANMLASHQAAQLLQLRALLVQQQQAELARAQAAADREAQEQAGHEQAYRHTINLVPGREWRIE